MRTHRHEQELPGDAGSLGDTDRPGGARRAVSLAAVALTLMVGCATLVTDPGGYFNDTVVGEIDIADPSATGGFTVLDAPAAGNDVFLAGEAHGVAENLEYAYALFRYLHDRHGVGTYLAEIGFAAGEQLNEYVQGSGTDADLESIMNASRGTYAWTAEWFSFWRRLRLWNAGLEQGSRIRVVGIDVEHQVSRGFEYVADRLPGDEPDPSIAGVASRLSRWSDLTDASAVAELAERAHASLAEHESAWRAYLGDSFHPVRITVANVVSRFAFYSDSSNAEIREAAIYRNFLDVYEHILGPDQRRFFGLWGNVHIPTAPVRGFSWLGSRLQHGADSPVAGKVFSIVSFYDRSTAMRTFPYRTSRLSSNRRIVRLFAPYARTPATLFYLDGDGSPFRQSPALAPGGQAPTTDMYQAAVLFSRARASRPLDTIAQRFYK